MFDFLMMAQSKHKGLGVTLTDPHEKQPVQQEKAGDVKNKQSGKQTLLPAFSQIQRTGNPTRLLGPAGG